MLYTTLVRRILIPFVALVVILLLLYVSFPYVFTGRDSSRIETVSLYFDGGTLTLVSSTTPMKSEDNLLWGAYKKYEFYDYPPIGVTALTGVGFYSLASIDDFEERRKKYGDGYWVGYSLSRSQWDEIDKLLYEGASTSKYSLFIEKGRRWLSYQIRCSGESCINHYFVTSVGNTMVIVTVTFWQDSSGVDSVFRKSDIEISE